MNEDNPIGWWRLRNGSYAQVKTETAVGCWKGLIHQEDGQPFCDGTWDRKYDNLISKDYDLTNRFGSSEEKGWPPWLLKLAGDVEKKENSVS